MTSDEAPEDDESLADDVALWRRVASDQWVYDGNLGRRRPSTSAFDNHHDGTPMSVVVASECSDGVDNLLRGHESFGVVEFTVGFARRLRQGVVRAPLPEQPSHAHVVGRKTDGTKKRFAREARIVRSGL